MKKIHATDQAPKAIGPYSQAVEAGGFVYVSGQIPIDPATGQMTGQTVAEQTDRVLRNIRAILEAAGLSMGNIVKTTVFLMDLGCFAEMNETYARHFTSDFPARATVQVSALPKGALVEIDAVAAR